MGQEYNEIKCFLFQGTIDPPWCINYPLPPPQQALSNTFLGLSFCLLHGFCTNINAVCFCKETFIFLFYYINDFKFKASQKNKTKQNKMKVRIPTINISTLNNTNAIFFTNHKSKVKPVKTCNKTTAGLSIFDQQMCQTELIGGVFLAPSMSSW
jgi:hypothetical protein